MKLIAIYGRVSTSRQENEETIQNQLHSIKEFADKKYINDGGYQIVREYTDEGWSGDSLIRPELDNLRQDAKKKIWDSVIIYDPDRLARRYSYQELVTDELKEAGIEVLFVTITPPANAEDKILYGVRGLFAEYERAKIAERFRQGKLRTLREGHLLVTEPLYGYRYIPNREGPNGEKIHGYYEIDEEEAKVVRMIFNWVAIDRLTLRSVVRRLKEMGIKPRRSPRGVWATSSLTHMLRHEGYIGKTHWGSSYAVVPDKPLNKEKYRKVKKSSRRTKPKSEWFMIDIPPIITEDIFLRARHQLEINYKMHPRNRKNDYLLSGLIRCTCGRTRAGEGPKQGKYVYYRCSDRISSFPLARTCFKKGINARIADQMVWDQVEELATSREAIAKKIESRKLPGQNEPKDFVVDVVATEREIKKLKKEEERYNRAYGEGVFTIEQLKEYLAPLREKMGRLETSIREMPTKEVEQDDLLAKLVGRCNIALEAPLTFERDLDFNEKREIIMRTIDQVIGDQEKLKVTGHLPIQSHVEDCPNHNKGVLSLISTSYVESRSNDRHCWLTKCGQIHAF